ncbi:Mitochondrial inner membrane translocase subunit Tim44 [Zostera marina]|uniref:Large ribosomal subunit protein mL45 n=1 Tax=Zostera marina TaxID=29655 RepID=A0A0K9P2C5_ZOSMR|nr:Mitochondrial inner membrane translocase subunit Tim44 [Zostera marina]
MPLAVIRSSVALRHLCRILRPIQQHHHKSTSVGNRIRHSPTYSDAYGLQCRSTICGISTRDFLTSDHYASTNKSEQLVLLNFFSSKVASQQIRQTKLKINLLSPGFVFEPYAPRVPIPFWQRWSTPSGWRRTKDDVVLEMKNAYAIARLRKKTKYSKKLFYAEALNLYKKVNVLLANGDRGSLRKHVTENMFSSLKNGLKRRESVWNSVYWELIEPPVSIKTLRARLIGTDKTDIDKSFIQLQIEIVTKQKFEAYDSNGVPIAGDKTKEVQVRDIWVFEKSLFHPESYWRVCAQLTC